MSIGINYTSFHSIPLKKPDRGLMGGTFSNASEADSNNTLTMSKLLDTMKKLKAIPKDEIFVVDDDKWVFGSLKYTNKKGDTKILMSMSDYEKFKHQTRQSNEPTMIGNSMAITLIPYSHARHLLKLHLNSKLDWKLK